MSLPCPLPQVQEALSPYIHPREETLRIRQSLTSHLTSQLASSRTRRDGDADGDGNRIISRLELACPPPTATTTTSLEAKRVPADFTGLRRRYLEAVQANADARAKYDGVKAEILELRRRDAGRAQSGRSGSGRGEADVEAEAEAARAYVALLRRRRLHGRLQIVQRSLAQLVELEPSPVVGDVAVMVRERVGEAPEPPLAAAGAGAGEREGPVGVVEGLTLKLKKEVLLAKHGLDRARDARER
ncbi:hypothetical protein LTS18_000695, partial [Coniosporium uncinatum]